MNYDVMIIGGGAIGSAIARELAGYHVKVGVLEKESDVCLGNSGRNTGLLHAGFLYAAGSLRARFCVEGNRSYDAFAEQLDVPLKRTGKLTVGSTQAERVRLEKLIENGKINGVPGMRIIEREELHALEPHVAGEFAMLSPTSAIISPYQYTIALAENAATNGVTYHLGQPLRKAERLRGGGFRLMTDEAVYEAKWVINSGGYNVDAVAEILGTQGYRMENTKGEYLILDTRAGEYLHMPVYPAPDENWVYDVHVTPTIDGNVLVGPTILGGIIDNEDFDTTAAARKLLLNNGANLFKPLRPNMVIRSFAALSPHLGAPKDLPDDFIVDWHEDENLIHLVRMDSPGITASCAIGRYVAGIIIEREHFSKNTAFDPVRKGIRRFAEQKREAQEAMIQENPDYGEIICRCECITKAEIMQALQNPLGVKTVTGVKYRTRASMGRCQGGYCETRMTSLIRQVTGVTEVGVRYSGKDSNMFTGKVRDL
ncbi:MAG: NAD(P)/FAD-dependent oxidoreductase [Clostridia bacterium]